MPAITATAMGAAGAQTVTETTLDGTDTFTWSSSDGSAVLIFQNDSGGALTPVLVGDGATSATITGVPDPVTLTGGYSMGSIADGASSAIRLKTAEKYLVGNLSITGATGIKVKFLTFV